jgi:hypothetical protein
MEQLEQYPGAGQPRMKVLPPRGPLGGSAEVRRACRDKLARVVSAREREREESVKVMVEPPGGENHGYRVNGRRASLNWRDWVTEGFLATPGWGIERPRSDRPVGRQKTVDPELLTPEGIAAVERRVGVSVCDFQRVTKKRSAARRRPGHAGRDRRQVRWRDPRGGSRRWACGRLQL